MILIIKHLFMMKSQPLLYIWDSYLRCYKDVHTHTHRSFSISRTKVFQFPMSF